MEILVGVVALILVLAVGISALSSKETKLFRRIWSSEKVGAFDAQTDAINELLTRFNVTIPANSENANLEKLGDNIGRLMGKAMEFDLRHKNNLGVSASEVLSRHLENKFSAAGIYDFNKQFSLLQNSEFPLSRNMGQNIDKNTNLLMKIRNTIDLLKTNITKGKEETSLHSHGSYYIGYIYGITQEICQQDRVECGDVYLTPVYQEIQRLFGSQADNLYEISSKQLADIVTTEHGEKGLQDGRFDGGFVANPNNPPPYFSRLQAYFA